MPNTFEKRATHALRTGDESFAPRTAKNRTLYEEMKKKLKNELAGHVAEGKACIHNAGDKAVRRVNDAADVAEEKITAAAADAIAKALTKRGFTPEAQAAKHASSTASSAACSKTSTATSIPDSGTTRPSSSTQLGSPSQQPPVMQPSAQPLPQPVQEGVQAKREDVARTSKKAKKTSSAT